MRLITAYGVRNVRSSVPLGSLKMSSPSGCFRFRVIDRLLRCRFWKSGLWRSMEIRGVVASRHFDLDDLRTPVRQLPDGRGPGVGAGEVEVGIFSRRFGSRGWTHRGGLSAGPGLRSEEARPSRR